MAGVSYDSIDILNKATERRGLGYTLLSDPKSVLIDRYRLRDLQYPPSSKAYGVPQPIIVFLKPDGSIAAKLYEDTYKKRPSMELVTATLDRLSAH